MGVVVWSPDAREDLRSIYDRATRAEILDIAERELIKPYGGSVLEKVVPTASTPASIQIFRRRAIYRKATTTYLDWSLEDDVDVFTDEACNYVIVYRYITPDERIKFRRAKRCFVVLRVLHNQEAARRGIY